MGLFSKKTKTKTNQQTTLTPTNPLWVDNAVSGLSDKINTTFAGFDPTKLAPGPTDLQTQAASAAGGLISPNSFGQASGLFQNAAGAGPQSVDQVNIADSIQGFMNPWQKDVIDTSLADYDFGAGMTRAQDSLAKAGDQTFGGSGGSIQTALSNDAINRGRGSLSAGLRSSGFDKASQLAVQQANLNAGRNLTNANFGESALGRQLQAGQGLAGLGVAQGANDRANIDTQSQLGEILRQIMAQQGAAPLTALGLQTDMTGKLPFNLFQGQTGTMTGNTTSKTSGASLGDWAKIAQAAAMAAAASDIRLKRDIVKVGERQDGLGVYLFRYLWSPVVHLGVMAQEVLKVKPAAVLIMPNGFYAVDYGQL